MISKRLYTLGLGLLTLVALPSCNDAIDTQQQRRENNEKVFRTFKGREGYSPVSIPGIYGSNFVYMKYTTRGKGKEKPAATDNVRCEYTGYLTTEWVEDSTQARPFDSNTSQTLITPARVNTYITGFAIALQNMVVGDAAEVVIPWYLGYGGQTVGGITSYSSLFFKLKLVEIVK